MFMRNTTEWLTNWLQDFAFGQGMDEVWGIVHEGLAREADEDAEAFEAAIRTKDAKERATYGWDGDGWLDACWALHKAYPADRQRPAKLRARALRAARRR